MHAGSGLRNKLNLTSSRELIRTGCCYLLCLLFGYLSRGSKCFIKPWPLSGSHYTQTTYLFMSLSCGFMLTHKSSCQICCEGEILGIALTLFFFLSFFFNVCSRLCCWSLLLKIVCAGSLSWQNEDVDKTALLFSPTADCQRWLFEEEAK